MKLAWTDGGSIEIVSLEKGMLVRKGKAEGVLVDLKVCHSQKARMIVG